MCLHACIYGYRRKYTWVSVMCICACVRMYLYTWGYVLYCFLVYFPNMGDRTHQFTQSDEHKQRYKTDTTIIVNNVLS